MTLLWVDGFDHYDSLEGGHPFAKKYDVASNGIGSSLVISTSETRSSSGAFHRDSSSTSSGDGKVGKAIPARSTLIMGAAFKFGENPTQTTLFSLLDNGSFQVELQLNTRNRLQVRRSTTVLATSDIGLKSNTWYFVEVKFTVNNSGSYEVRVNGKTVMSGTNVDTQTTANASADEVNIADNASADGRYMWIDDFYICDTNGSINNDFLGECRVATLLPNGNGNSSQFIGSDGNSTDNYLLVDESPCDTGTYVETSGVGNIDLYAIPSLPSASQQIHGVQVCNLVDKSDAGALTGVQVIRTNATNYTGLPYQPSFGDFVFYTNIWEQNPNSSSGWTDSNIDSLEIGCKLEA